MMTQAQNNANLALNWKMRDIANSVPPSEMAQTLADTFGPIMGYDFAEALGLEMADKARAQR